MSAQVISKPFPQVDALAKVTGRQRYISDIRLPGMIWGHIVRSPYPHAKIKRIASDKALRVPGVKAIITSADTPHNPFGPFNPDWVILPKEKVIYAGQPVAAVAAVDHETAEEAAHLVHVEYESLPALFDPENAMSPDAPLIHEGAERNVANHFALDKGDVDKAFGESDFVRDMIFHPSTQFHSALEPNGAIAAYDPINQSYTLWAATQTPYPAWLLYCRALGTAQKKLRLIPTAMGGGFGSKFESILHLIALYLSKKVERPVRLVNTFEEEFVTAPLRVPMSIHLMMGIKKNGLITAKTVEVIADNGAFTCWGPAILSTACYRVDNLYRILNSRARGYLVYTNNTPKGAFRGFGQPQSLFGVEAVLDQLAEDIDMDPGELRIVNGYRSGETTVHGWSIGSCGLSDCVRKAQKISGWHDKRKIYASQTGAIRRGIGLACCNHVAGNRACLKEFDGSHAMVRVNADGRILLSTGEVDMGQGYATIATQIAAEELGVPMDWIQVASPDSQESLLGIGSFASRATVMGGNAVRIAAGDARRNILKALGGFLDKNADNLFFENGLLRERATEEVLGTFLELIPQLIYYRAGQPFVGIGRYVPDVTFVDPDTKYGNPSPVYPFAAHVAEVEVDTESGVVKVIDYVAANDVGKAINPLLVRGQLEGGVVQGMGYAISERLVIRDGRILNKNLSDYKIPTIADIPNIVPVIVEEADIKGPYGAKSVGEAAIDPVAAAICNAVYNAVGIRITRLPIRPETLLEAMKNEDLKGVLSKSRRL